MKKLLALSIALFLVLFATGCSEGENSASSSDSVNSTPQQTSNVSAPIDQAEESDGFEQIKAAFDKAEYSYETTQMAAELVGAEKGEKYTFDFGKVELYLFSDGAEPLTSGEVILEGFGSFPISVNGNYGVIIDVTENESEITAIFNELK